MWNMPCIPIDSGFFFLFNEEISFQIWITSSIKPLIRRIAMGWIHQVIIIMDIIIIRIIGFQMHRKWISHNRSMMIHLYYQLNKHECMIIDRNYSCGVWQSRRKTIRSNWSRNIFRSGKTSIIKRIFDKMTAGETLQLPETKMVQTHGRFHEEKTKSLVDVWFVVDRIYLWYSYSFSNSWCSWS